MRSGERHTVGADLDAAPFDLERLLPRGRFNRKISGPRQAPALIFGEHDSTLAYVARIERVRGVLFVRHSARR
jgi:hypothetical protein